MEDYIVAQEHNQPFHYSWLLVPMDFIMWKEPKYTQYLSAQGECQGVHYTNLWANADLERQHINNQLFYTYYQQLSTSKAGRPRITKELTNLYKKEIRFMVDMHRIYTKPRGIKEKDWYTRAYQMEQQDVQEIIKEWPEEWRNPTIDISDFDEDQEK